MKLIELLDLQHDRLEAAAGVFRAMLAEHKPGSPAFESLNKHLSDIVAEQRERKVFALCVKNALRYCRSYRNNPSAVLFAQLRLSYDRLFVSQDHPLAAKYLPKMPPLGARAGCRSCAKVIIERLEEHLTQDVEDTFPIKWPCPTATRKYNLGALGEQHPYPNSYKPENTIVEKATDMPE